MALLKTKCGFLLETFQVTGTICCSIVSWMSSVPCGRCHISCPVPQSCTKLVGTHALLIIITFIIKMYVHKMTCMIQYSCSKHASSPSLPHQAMLVYICFLFIRSALSLTTLILGSGGQSFYYKVSKQFRTRLYPTAEKKNKYQNQKMSHKIQTRCRNCVIFAGNNV